MVYNKKYIQKSTPFKSIGSDTNITQTIYYAEVISIEDPTDGGRIKVRIKKFDGEISNNNLPWAYPLIPKFINIFPKVGELVRVFIEDIRYPERGRFWVGSVISQPHKIAFDSLYTAQSTTDMMLMNPEKAPSTFIDSHGVFPEKEDIALVGRKNNDIILKENETLIRTGKHFENNILKLNTKNPATLNQTFENIDGQQTSTNILMSDKIALISHDGIPKFKSHSIDNSERKRIFEEGHPMVRGDILVAVLHLIRKTIISHIHGYSSLPADKDALIKDLEKLNFDSILQKNIVIN